MPRASVDLVADKAVAEGPRRKQSRASAKDHLSRITKHRELLRTPQLEWISQSLQELCLVGLQTLWFRNRTHIRLRHSHSQPAPLIRLVRGSRPIAENRVTFFLLHAEGASQESCVSVPGQFFFVHAPILPSLRSFLALCFLSCGNDNALPAAMGAAAKRACRLQERRLCERSPRSALRDHQDESDAHLSEGGGGGGPCRNSLMPCLP